MLFHDKVPTFLLEVEIRKLRGVGMKVHSQYDLINDMEYLR